MPALQIIRLCGTKFNRYYPWKKDNQFVTGAERIYKCYAMIPALQTSSGEYLHPFPVNLVMEEEESWIGKLPLGSEIQQCSPEMETNISKAADALQSWNRRRQRRENGKKPLPPFTSQNWLNFPSSCIEIIILNLI